LNAPLEDQAHSSTGPRIPGAALRSVSTAPVLCVASRLPCWRDRLQVLHGARLPGCRRHCECIGTRTLLIYVAGGVGGPGCCRRSLGGLCFSTS